MRLTRGKLDVVVGTRRTVRALIGAVDEDVVSSRWRAQSLAVVECAPCCLEGRDVVPVLDRVCAEIYVVVRGGWAVDAAYASIGNPNGECRVLT